MSRPSANPVGNPREAQTLPVRSENTAPLVIPEPPEGLTEWGQALWGQLWRVGHGVYKPDLHGETIARYVEMQERRRKFLRILEEEGWTVVGSQGQDVLHPIARQLDSLEGKLVALEDRLGLSPEASIRLGIASLEHRSRLDDFLAGSGN